VLIEGFKEEGRLRRIEAVILVERDSQKAIVIGARGERLKAMASAARRDIALNMASSPSCPLRAGLAIDASGPGAEWQTIAI
jgi:GTPase Era involved in 16S rRNA processing